MFCRLRVQSSIGDFSGRRLPFDASLAWDVCMQARAHTERPLSLLNQYVMSKTETEKKVYFALAMSGE